MALYITGKVGRYFSSLGLVYTREARACQTWLITRVRSVTQKDAACHLSDPACW